MSSNRIGACMSRTLFLMHLVKPSASAAFIQPVSMLYGTRRMHFFEASPLKYRTQWTYVPPKHARSFSSSSEQFLKETLIRMHSASGNKDVQETIPSKQKEEVSSKVDHGEEEIIIDDDLELEMQRVLKEQEEEDADYVFEGPKRCGTVAILGAPNAGKSTLLNTLVGSKVAIVTHKRQTTRNSINGIAMEGGTQVIYIDTPGIMAPKPKQRLNKAMVKSAWNSARDADEIFFLIDADKIIPGGTGPGRIGRKSAPLTLPVDPERLKLRPGTNEELIMSRLTERRQRYSLILNKVDELEGDRRGVLLQLAETLRLSAGLHDNGESMVKKVFAVSAKTGRGLDSLKAYLKDSLPLGPWLYPVDQISNIPMRNLVAEFTRESIFLRAHEEVPYACYVETESYETQANGSIRIEQTIYVETEGQKKILIGMIKDLSTRSRLEMMKFLECTVHLFLKIKLKKGWTDNNQAMYDRLGLDFNA
eukprot:752060-Hanusia_phi.AAC.7